MFTSNAIQQIKSLKAFEASQLTDNERVRRAEIILYNHACDWRDNNQTKNDLREIGYEIDLRQADLGAHYEVTDTRNGESRWVEV